jgi:Amt family ammonium transporter
MVLNLASTMVQCLAVLAVVSLVWTLWGYSLAFGPTIHGFIGDLSDADITNVEAAPNPAYSSMIPELFFFAFQLAVAALFLARLRRG